LIAHPRVVRRATIDITFQALKLSDQLNSGGPAYLQPAIGFNRQLGLAIPGTHVSPLKYSC
jgi:hypothetical protein